MKKRNDEIENKIVHGRGTRLMSPPRSNKLLNYSQFRNNVSVVSITNTQYSLPPAYVVRREVMFSLCPPRKGGGYPSLRFFLCSLVLSWGRTPVPGSFPALVPGPFPVGGYPTHRSLVPCPFQGGIPVLTGRYPRVGYPPGQVRVGYPPPPQDGIAERALATRRAVCLLRSRRRTFLFTNNFTLNKLVLLIFLTLHSFKPCAISDCS